jgi:hypothetical protein
MIPDGRSHLPIFFSLHEAVFPCSSISVSIWLGIESPGWASPYGPTHSGDSDRGSDARFGRGLGVCSFDITLRLGPLHGGLAEEVQGVPQPRPKAAE